MRINTSLLTTLTQTIKTNPFKNVSNKFANLFSKISGVKNNNENLKHQPAKFLKCFSSNYDSTQRRQVQTGFLSHFGHYQEPAIFIHGSGTHFIDGKGIIYDKGVTVDYKNLAGEEMPEVYLNVKEFVAAVKKDFNLDLHRTGNTGDKPLHLISCYAGSYRADSIAGQLSRELDRSVVTYGEDVQVCIFGKLIDKTDEPSRIYSPDSVYPNGILKPLKPIIHFPDNQPGRIRE